MKYFSFPASSWNVYHLMWVCKFIVKNCLNTEKSALFSIVMYKEHVGLCVATVVTSLNAIFYYLGQLENATKIIFFGQIIHVGQNQNEIETKL